MTVFIFPGQGSQYVGMGKEFYSQFKVAKQTFEEASDSIGIDIANLCFEGDQSKLSLTANAQPAILTTSVAILRVLQQETDLTPDFVAGHSLGEYSALVASSCLSLTDAALAVRRRGEFMQDAVPVGVGSMAAILGLEASEVINICETISTIDNIVNPANFNSPGQVVISGHKDAVEKALNISKERGARRVVPLDVSAPFHCELMEPAAKKLSALLDNIVISDIKYPVVNNVEAKVNSESIRVKQLLVDQVVNPVKWTDTTFLLKDMGVNLFLEIGPSNVLSGLIKRTIKDISSLNIEKIEQLDHIKENGI